MALNGKINPVYGRSLNLFMCTDITTNPPQKRRRRRSSRKRNSGQCHTLELGTTYLPRVRKHCILVLILENNCENGDINNKKEKKQQEKKKKKKNICRQTI